MEGHSSQTSFQENFEEKPQVQGETISTFISYTHDSEDHKNRVRELAIKLRSDGINCEIDQFHESPKQGWVKWMIESISNSKYVLVICTENYNKRANGEERLGLN